MARTQAAEYDERRQAIVEVAARIFAREGFASASLAGIAKSAAMSKSLIYHYFKSKEEILYEAMIDHVRALEDAARAAVSGDAKPERKLRELIHRFMTLYVGAADRHKVLLNDLDHLPKARRAEIVSAQRGLIQIVRKLLTEIEPALKRKNGQAKAAAMLLFGMINWTHTWFDPKGAVSPGALAEMAADVVLGGLKRAAE